MNLFEYVNMFDNVCWDIPDNEIDYTVTICGGKNCTYEDDADFPYFSKFFKKFLEIMEIEKCMDDGCPIVKMTDAILSNKKLCLKFAKKWWQENYVEAVTGDDVELCYQFIKEFDNVAGGRYGETMNKAYYNLLCKFEENKGLSLN